MTNPIETSIIIRTYNEEKHLARLLEGILSQGYKKWEIIIVDSGSTDRTLDIAKHYPLTILTIPKESFSFGYSLNTGCEKAAGDYLIFVSAHTYPLNNQWLENMTQPFEDPRIGMVYGRQIGNEITKISEAKDLLLNFGEKSRILVEESFGNNANAAILKSLWEEIPFDPSLPGLEDVDWAHKIQKKDYYVYYKADAVIYHIHDETYRQIYNRFKRETIAYKTIFPDYHYSKHRAFWVAVLAMARDISFGISHKKPIKNIISAVPYRFFEFRGCRDGYLHQGPLEKNLKKELYFPQKNRNVVICGANKHKLTETEIPSLQDEEVLISVRYVGVCGTDLDILEGNLDYYKSGRAQYPIIPGHEFSGIVAAVGRSVYEFVPGDKVVGECIMGCGTCQDCCSNRPLSCKNRQELGVLNFDGAYTRYLKMPAQFLHKLPSEAPLEKACLIEPLAVSLRAINKLLRGSDHSPGKVGILGFGAIGNLCAQILNFRGYEVTVFDHNPLRIRGLGNSRILGRKDITDLGHFEYLIEATGQTEVLRRVLEESKPGVKILLLGLPYSPIDFNFEKVVCLDKTIIGSVGSTKYEFVQAIATYEMLDLESLVQNFFPLEDYETAWLRHRRGQVPKAILKIRED
jgi:threonine dehydrogenase-like Zn-dependent dehydrogenase/glycosyltransferase involved in cell wall biosynthesis